MLSLILAPVSHFPSAVRGTHADHLAHGLGMIVARKATKSKNIKTYSVFIYHIIPYALFHSLNVFSIYI